jgi:hypothetical protein
MLDLDIKPEINKNGPHGPPSNGRLRAGMMAGFVSE